MPEATLASVTDELRQATATDTGLGKRIKFDFGDSGVVMIDASVVPNVVSNANESADCTLTMSLADYARMAAGELNATTAFMTGKLKVAGDMALALKLDSLIK
jgi:putative sterol carrier protein